MVAAIVGIVGLFFVLLLSTARRRDEDRAARGGEERPEERVPALTGREVERAVVLAREGREVVTRPSSPAPAPPRGPLDAEALGVTRRQFLNRSIVNVFGLSIGAFGLAVVAQLWPSLSGGFGAKVRAGDLEDILSKIREKKEPFYVPAGRFYINPYPKDAVPKAAKVSAYSAVLDGYKAGVVALYQKCVHLGCRVPWCPSSQWFECPCHGSQYNRVGEKKGGPAPRGLDRFMVSVEGGSVMVDTKTVVTGPPIGTNTTGQEAEGPHCIGGKSE